MEKIERKILSIVQEPRIWGDDRNGNGRAAEVGFVLETKEGVREYGEYRSTESAWSKVVERSLPSVGQVFTFDAEPKKPYKGTTQWGLKSYPGKPEGKYDGGGSGGGGKKGDWESSVERADRRLNDAAGKVLGVAAVMIGDGGSPAERAEALGQIVGQVADAFALVRESLKPDFPNLGTVEPAPVSAPTTAPVATTQAPPAEPESKTWGPAPKPQDASGDEVPLTDLDHAWAELVTLKKGSGAKALLAMNSHFDRKANRADYTAAEVLEVLVALS